MLVRKRINPEGSADVSLARLQDSVNCFLLCQLHQILSTARQDEVRDQ